MLFLLEGFFKALLYYWKAKTQSDSSVSQNILFTSSFIYVVYATLPLKTQSLKTKTVLEGSALNNP